eukprot:m.142564 g.142564  ORF g.142564 m.142564 type:complete len:608 (-) comp15997_c0_seq4:255-2078(-)
MFKTGIEDEDDDDILDLERHLNEESQNSQSQSQSSHHSYQQRQEDPAHTHHLQPQQHHHAQHSYHHHYHHPQFEHLQPVREEPRGMFTFDSQEEVPHSEERHHYRRRSRPSQNNSIDRGTSALSDGMSEDGLLSFQVRDEEIIYTQEPNVKIIGRYLFGDRLGDGSYSKVKEALDVLTLQRYAVKIMKNRRIRKFMYGQENVRREIQILRRLKHKNVTRLHDVLYNHAKEKIYVVLEYCHSNLQDMLKSAPQEKFPLWQAQHYFVQLLDALAYIHSQGVIHRDIKPSNILVQSGDQIKLSDFGVADVLDRFDPSPLCTKSSGTHVFQSPELAEGATSFDGVKVDVWAAGVTLWNLVTGHYPFFDDNVVDLFTNISKCQYEVPSNLPEPLRDLLTRALTRDPTNRASVEQLQRHRWCSQSLPRDEEAVDLVYRPSTVLPYLEMMYDEALVGDAADAEGRQSGLVSPDMVVISRRSSFGPVSPPFRSRSRSRASNVSPPSSPHSDRSERSSRASSTLRRLWHSLFGERSASRERHGPGRHQQGSTGQLAVPAIDEEDAEVEEELPARSVSTENLNDPRRNSTRSNAADEPTERGRSYSSTITRNPKPFI